MSGIFGIVHHDGRPADRAGVTRMSGASRTRAVDGEALWIQDAAAIGHQYSRVTPESIAERQPFAWDDAVISFDGRLDNRDELLRSCDCAAAGEHPVSDAAIVLAAYRAYGDACAARLVGDFAFALLDRRQRRLLLVRDVMAARPLYYVSLGNGIAFASEIKSLLAHPAVAAKPDEDGLADLVLNGYCDGHTTWFEGIRTVPPGHVVAVTPERVTVTRAWDFDGAEIRYAAASDYVDHFRMLFSQAVSRRLRSAHPVAVSVSGGVDSSAIHCVAARLSAARLRGLTLAFPKGTAADEHPFIDVLRGHGLRIDDIPVDGVRWLRGDQSVARMEMPSLLWEKHDLLLARARQAGCRVLLSGFFGDQILTGAAYLVDLARRGHWALVRRHLRQTAAWMSDVDPGIPRRWFLRAAARAVAPAWMRRVARVTLDRTLKRASYAPWFTNQFRERALQRALDRAGLPRRFASAHADEYWRLATSGYYLSALLQTGSAGVAHQLDTAYPFRDRDLVAFLIGIPGDVVVENGVPKGLLRRSLEGILPDAIRLRRTKGDGTAFSNGAALAEENTVRQLLNPDSLSARAGFLDPGVLRTKMPALFGTALRCDDTAHIGWQIGDTLALELWLQRFCGDMTCN